MSYVLCFLMALFSTSVFAADADLKQEVQKIASAYADSFNRQDAAGIAARYAAGGVLVNPTGPHADIAEFYIGLCADQKQHRQDDLQVRPSQDIVKPVGKSAAGGGCPDGEGSACQGAKPGVRK